jgi:hypothetical protein
MHFLKARRDKRRRHSNHSSHACFSRTGKHGEARLPVQAKDSYLFSVKDRRLAGFPGTASTEDFTAGRTDLAIDSASCRFDYGGTTSKSDEQNKKPGCPWDHPGFEPDLIGLSRELSILLREGERPLG